MSSDARRVYSTIHGYHKYTRKAYPRAPLQFHKTTGKAHPRAPHPLRKVYVSVLSWVGMSAGASHYYADVSEEANAMLVKADDEEFYWASLPEMPTRTFRKSFKTKAAAVEACKQFVQKTFSADTHEVHDRSDGIEGVNTWLKRRRS